MCIIIVKEKGVKYPSMENVQNACDNNPDGFAIAWANNNKLETYKTMVKKDFIKKCKEVFKLDFKTTSVVIHARIATHGSKRLNNCHCWIDKATALSFAHNGVLSIKNRGDMTDSETFFRDIFLPIYKTSGWSGVVPAINAIIGTSKFAFIRPNGEIKLFGNYNTLKGVMYSNTSYLARTTYLGSYGSSASSSGYKYRDSYWDPIDKKTIYRTTQTDKEWQEEKDLIASLIFWDYSISGWRTRGTETDAEWARLKENSEKAWQERMKIWNNSRWDDCCY